MRLRPTQGGTVAFALWIAAALLVIVGIVLLLQGSILLGILAIVVGLLVGPGGVSITGARRTSYR